MATTLEPDALNVLPMQDEFDTPEESPYLRRQKSAPVWRSRFSPRLRVVLFVIAVMLPVGFAGYALATFALTSPYFVLDSPDDVVVTGNHFVSREEVLGSLALPLTGNIKRGTNVFHMTLDVQRHGVEALPWVRAASVTRIMPHGLLVHITERTPVAYANVGGRVSLVDEDGVLLDKPENGVFDFPVLYGLESIPSADDRRTRLGLYMNFMGQLGTEAPRAGWIISEVYLSDGEDVKALLIQGQRTVQVHFGQKDFSQRFQNFLTLLPEIQKSNDKIDSVDLRYRNQVVVDPQTSTPPAEPTVPASGDRKG
jgi:cell division protein FtsQ